MNKAKYFVVHNKIENYYELEVLHPGWDELNPKFDKLSGTFNTYQKADLFGQNWIKNIEVLIFFKKPS